MRKSDVRCQKSDVRGIIFFLIAVLCPLTSVFGQATYVPRAIKELDDAHGVTLSLKFAPMWDGTKFTPRFISQSDVTDLVSDLSGKVHVSRTVNGHPLSSDVTIAYGDLDGPFPTFPASMGATASNFFTSYNSASGLFTKAQPVFSDLSGTPTTLAGYGITDGVADSRTVNGHPLSANVTVAYSELGGPFPTFPANTGATANQFFTAYADTTGLFSKAQPSIANLSDAGTLTTWAGITPGTGVGTALGVNVGSTGAFVTKDGALGTPSSGTATNLTGLPIGTGVSGLGTGVGTFLATPTSANLLAALTDETGTGAAVFASTPTLVTPVLGAATATSVTMSGGGALGGSSGAVTLTASGTNQSITLTPSGTGQAVMPAGTATVPGITTVSRTTDGISNPNGQLYFLRGGVAEAKIAGGFTVASNAYVRWTNTTSVDTATDIGFYRNAAGVVEVNSGTAGTLRDIKARNHITDSTVTGAGTTGAQTINKNRGTVRFAAAATTLVVTNSLVTATSKIAARGIGAFDITATNFQCTAASGSFTITANAAATAETEVLFDVMIP